MISLPNTNFIFQLNPFYITTQVRTKYDENIEKKNGFNYHHLPKNITTNHKN